MHFQNKKKALLIILLAGVLALGFVWIRSYVFSHLGLGIHKKIQSLELSGFNVKYDSLTLDWKNKIIEIHGLLLEKNRYDTTCIYPEFISVAKVRAEGIGLIALVFHDILDIDRLYLDSLRMFIRQRSLFLFDSAAQRDSEFNLRTNKVFLRGAALQYTDSATCKIIARVQSSFTIEGLEMEFRVEKAFRYTAERLIVNATQISLPADFYTLTTKGLIVDLARETLWVDTVRIFPDFGKLEFGRRRGYEVDRFEGEIPFIKASNFSFSLVDTTWVSASRAEVQFLLKIFRDKRLPFRKVPKQLPVDAIQSLPFGLVVDSLAITHSYVQYEEFPEEASDPGGVFFDKLNAVFTNIRNDSKKGAIRLEAKGSLMGDGAVSVSVTFPLNRNNRSTLLGTLENFPIPRINPMLTPSTNIRVQSGKMNKLAFNFLFNATRSDGELELNYEDLKLISYKDEDETKRDEKKDGPRKDNLKTFMMNTFIFKRNMDEDVPQDKRMGTVSFVRDDNRSVFNFWVKSLMSGIKSAYDLDHAAEKKSERELKKEQRLARQLERKLKKEALKKERG